ncbi:MAG: hypothetical protein COA69_08715 [Robiginitomaculum sp.]|nr:MAG: hypothetical protein COA69_08715 [Robiginitomaculum sp.]
MFFVRVFLIFGLCLSIFTHSHAQERPQERPQERRKIGDNLFLENLPENIKFWGDAVDKHTTTISNYSVKGWSDDGRSLLLYGYGNLYKARGPKHKLKKVLDLSDHPVSNAQRALVCGAPGFVFLDDEDGDEYYATYAAKIGAKVPDKLSYGIAKTRAYKVSNDLKYVAYASSVRGSGIWTLEYQEICKGSSPVRLYEGRAAIYVKDFHPNHSLLLVTTATSNGMRLSEFNLETKAEDAVLDIKGSLSSVSYSHDGHYIFYVTNEGVNYRELFRYDRRTGDVINVVGNIGLDIDFVASSDDRTKLAVIINKMGISRIAVLDSVNLKLAAPFSQKSLGVVSSAYFSPDGEKLAVRLSQPTVPSRSGVYDYKKDKFKLWTGGFKPGTKTIKLVPAIITYPTFDWVDEKPRQIPVLAYKPETATITNPAPVVIFAHGGPASQARPTWSEFYHYIVTEMGVAVLRPNIRGSSGYGHAFEQLDQIHKREDSIRDIGALLDWIEGQPDLDASRVMIAGGSYGGYVSMASLAMYPDRFKAGITRVGVLDFQTFLENTEANRVQNRRREYGDERDAEVAKMFERISPLQNVDKITKPVLIIQGARDPRVPLQQAEDMLMALKKQGVEVSYVLAMDEGHGYSKRKNRRYSTGAQIAFIRRHLLD